MAYRKKRAYIVQYGFIFYYFYLVNDILYIEILHKDSKNIRKRLQTNIKEFSACLDNSSNTIHIVGLDTSHRLIHLFYKENIWKKRLIPDFKLDSTQLSSLRVYCHRDKLNLILSKSHNPRMGIWKIIHLAISNRTFNLWKVAEIHINKHLLPYRIDIDMDNNIHVIYRSMRKDRHILFYRMFNSKYSKWSLAAKLSRDEDDVINMNLLCDTKNYIHVVWSYLHDKNIKVNYLRKKTTSPLTSGWKKSKTFPNILSNFTNPILLQCKDYIKLIWKMNDKFYYAKAKSDRDLWSSARTIKGYFNHPIIPITYIGSSYKEQELVKLPFAYGYYNKEIFIMGLDEPSIEDGFPGLSFKEINKNPFKSISLEEEKDMRLNLKRFTENIKAQLNKEEIISNILYNKKNN
ncbi:MAG: hypothetical protein MJA82_06695 [Clostridia bacterium]|nr:hypothetical protein [Clostridia bacterium]